MSKQTTHTDDVSEIDEGDARREKMEVIYASISSPPTFQTLFFFFKLSQCLQTIIFYLVKIRILQTARAHLISAREHSAINNLIEAEKEYRKSILLDPEDAEVIIEFAKFLTAKVDEIWLGTNESDTSPILRCSSYAEAKYLFEEALSDDMPTRTSASDADAYFELGCLAQIGDYRKSIPFFKDALKSDPDNYAKVELLTMMKCRPWLFLPDDDNDDGDNRTPLFDVDVEYDIFIEKWVSGSLG
jgi:tetratricopeptide (TPR) repeat protein